MNTRRMMAFLWIVLSFNQGMVAMADPKKVYTAPTDDWLLSIAETRRSTRQYTDEVIAPEIINKILTVAMLAPSSYGQNPVDFVVVTDKAKLAEPSYEPAD